MNVNLYTDNSFSLAYNSLKLVNVTGPNSLVGYNSDITRCLNKSGSRDAAHAAKSLRWSVK